MEIYRCAFAIKGRSRFLAHLDIMQCFMRALKRGKVPVAYSEGFNPHIKIAFGPAHAVGVASEAEYFDLELQEAWPEEQLLAVLKANLPPNLQMLAVRCLPEKLPALMASINYASYEAQIADLDLNWIRQQIDATLQKTELLWQRFSPKGNKTIDLRPFILDIKAADASISFAVKMGNNGNARPEEVLKLLGLAKDQIVLITRTSQMILNKGQKVLP